MNKTKAIVSATTARKELRASSGLVNAIATTVGSVEGVDEIRVLHRDHDDRVSKFFVMLRTPSVAVIDRVVEAMLQIEEAFGRFDYDTVPNERSSLVPAQAKRVS
jgi:hypothetical protein